ncbi:hypothetical protein GCM10008949_25120 [Deinococcus humi]|nr:hypothetical protein GCM10008949_25120 [Deinococcus humi]
MPPAGLDLMDGTQVDLMIHMLTSQLVDADWTATEEHLNPQRAVQRRSLTLLDVASRFEEGRCGSWSGSWPARPGWCSRSGQKCSRPSGRRDGAPQAVGSVCSVCPCPPGAARPWRPQRLP